MTRAPRSERRLWSLRNVATTASVAVFLTLVGSGASYAYWTATANVTATVSTGQVTVGLSTAGLDAVFGNDLTPASGSFTVHNTSTASGIPSITLSSAATEAAGFAVSVWRASGTDACAAVAAPDATKGTWAGTTVTGRALTAGGSARYCVLTSVPDRSVVASANGSLSVKPSIVATLTVGSWTGTDSASATISTSQIFQPMNPAPVVGDTFTNGSACAEIVTNEADASPCANKIAVGSGWLVQLRSIDNYQLVSPTGLCLQAFGGALTEEACSAAQEQQFSYVPVVTP